MNTSLYQELFCNINATTDAALSVCVVIEHLNPFVVFFRYLVHPKGQPDDFMQNLVESLLKIQTGYVDGLAFLSVLL